MSTFMMEVILTDSGTGFRPTKLDLLGNLLRRCSMRRSNVRSFRNPSATSYRT